jgi:putative phosphoribosyl transferase
MQEILIPVDDRHLRGLWTNPQKARGVVLFAHGSGSGRWSPRNQAVAKYLQDAGFATLLMDLLDDDEAEDRVKVFDVDLLANRILGAIDWALAQESTRDLPIGLFGASTGSAAALGAAARRPGVVRAVVSRGGRPDLAFAFLAKVSAPTLLIVGECDEEVLELNRKALRRLGGVHELRVVPNATHLFPEPGALAHVARLAQDWFEQHLTAPAPEPIDLPPECFADRAQAGRCLAERFHGRTFTDPVVLAIPRGGIVLGAELADALHADFDVILSRKLRMPGNPEFAVGAIAENGEMFLNVDERRMPPRLQVYLDHECQHQLEEIGRRRDLFRSGRPPICVAGRSVIVTDDGIATGSTMIAALRTLRAQRPLELIVAVPVAATDRCLEA